MKYRKLKIVSIGFGVLLGSVLLGNFFKSQKELPDDKELKSQKKFVKTDPVKYSNISTEVEAYGRVISSESLDIIAEVSGKMKQANKTPLKEGQTFKKGALLFRVDKTEQKYALRAKKSGFLKDLAGLLPYLKIDFPQSYSKWQSFFEAIDINKRLPLLPEYSSSKEKVFLATKDVFNKYYTIKSEEARLAKYNYFAPFTGSFSNIILQSGSYVNPGSKIAIIKKSKQLELKVDIGIDDINWVEKGTKLIVSTDDNSKKWNGTVIRIGENINVNTQTLSVYIGINETGKNIYDGMYLKAAIPGKNVQKAMVIPRNAIFNNDYVYVLKDSLLKVKEIKIHKLNEETAVFSGLSEGDDVVVEPLLNAHNNMKAYKLNSKDNRIAKD